MRQIWLAAAIFSTWSAFFAASANADNTEVNRVIADNQHAVTPILNGQKIPDVTIYDVRDKAYLLTELVKEKPTILIFYRGGWCPYCSAQLGRIKALEPKLLELGYQIIALSPDSPQRLQSAELKSYFKAKIMSDKTFDASEQFGLGYFLEDKLANIYRKKLGVEFVNINGESRVALPVPAVYIIDKNGVVQFNYVNPDYKVRLDEELLFEAARVLTAPSI